MHRGYRSLLAFAAIALVFASGPASAADFTFTVPVKLANLPPDSRQGMVQCLAYIGPIGPGLSTLHLAGNGFSMFPISGGAYEGEVTVTIDARPGVDPATATHYSCALQFNATLRGRDNQFGYSLGATPGPALPVAPGAPYSPRVDGAIR